MNSDEKYLDMIADNSQVRTELRAVREQLAKLGHGIGDEAIPNDAGDHWMTRGIAGSLLFAGILMAGGGFLAAAAVAFVSVPLAMLNFTWPAISAAATITFMAGLARLCGWHLLPG